MGQSTIGLVLSVLGRVWPVGILVEPYKTQRGLGGGCDRWSGRGRGNVQGWPVSMTCLSFSCDSTYVTDQLDSVICSKFLEIIFFTLG